MAYDNQCDVSVLFGGTMKTTICWGMPGNRTVLNGRNARLITHPLQVPGMRRHMIVIEDLLLLKTGSSENGFYQRHCILTD